MMKSALVLIFLSGICLGVVLSQTIPRRNRDKIIRKFTTTPTTTRAPSEDDELSEDCPEPYGFFADADQCDKYHACSNGRIEERLCPDGLVFNDYDIEVEKCDLPYNIDCSKRPNLQTPIPSLHCPRQNGYFGHEDKGVCDKFYYCVEGQFNMITCPQGLVFNPKTGICTWPDEAHKHGCSSEDVFNGFKCKAVNESIAATHPRYADPDDCQFFYVCINGAVPRRNGCKLGEVFDERSGFCSSPRNVPKCRDFYKDRLTEAQLDLIENPTTAAPKKSKRPSRPQRKKQTARTEDEEERY